jgi:hypothetical protein
MFILSLKSVKDKLFDEKKAGKIPFPAFYENNGI